MSCDRKKSVRREWVNDWTGETEYEYQTVEECEFYDTSLHTYACSVCGKSFPYCGRPISTAAKESPQEKA